MRNIPKDCRAFLMEQSTVTALAGKHIYHGSVPQNQETTYIWLSRSGSQNMEALDDGPGQEPVIQYLDLECIATNLGLAEDLAAAVQSLFPRGGAFGSASIQRAYCNTQDDSYDSRNTARAENTHLCALSLEIYP